MSKRLLTVVDDATDCTVRTMVVEPNELACFCAGLVPDDVDETERVLLSLETEGVYSVPATVSYGGLVTVHLQPIDEAG